MSLLPASGPRPSTTPLFPASAQAGGKLALVQVAPASGNIAAPLPTVDPVKLQDDVVSLSRQGLQAKGVELAASTSENAQNLMNTFAKRLFGDTAQTSTVAYKMTSFQSSSSAAAVSDAQGTVHGETFNLSQSTSFTGTGQLVTADGRSFDFTISVKYEANVQGASAGTASEQPGIETQDVLMLTGKPLPAIKFPGSLDDLFKLLSRELRTDVSGAAGPSDGNLTLRLMRLVDRAALLAPRARADDPEATPTERAKAVADSYGSAAAMGAPAAT